jgi:hypothetical protein
LHDWQKTGWGASPPHASRKEKHED